MILAEKNGAESYCPDMKSSAVDFLALIPGHLSRIDGDYRLDSTSRETKNRAARIHRYFSIFFPFFSFSLLEKSENSINYLRANSSKEEIIRSAARGKSVLGTIRS